MTGQLETQPTPDLIRPMLESAIERLIAILDEISPDPDLEDTGDGEPDEDGEPLYGWTEMQSRSGQAYGPYGQDADGCELDEADSEPELGSLEGVNQLRWSKGRDGEPSLGSMENIVSQSAWGRFAGQDYEWDCDDEGAVETDCGFDEDDPGYVPQWGHPRDEHEVTTRACIGAIARVRHLQQRRGQRPVQPLRVLGGAIVRG